MIFFKWLKFVRFLASRASKSCDSNELSQVNLGPTMLLNEAQSPLWPLSQLTKKNSDFYHLSVIQHTALTESYKHFQLVKLVTKWLSKLCIYLPPLLFLCSHSRPWPNLEESWSQTVPMLEWSRPHSVPVQVWWKWRQSLCYLLDLSAWRWKIRNKLWVTQHPEMSLMDTSWDFCSIVHSIDFSLKRCKHYPNRFTGFQITITKSVILTNHHKVVII